MTGSVEHVIVLLLAMRLTYEVRLSVAQLRNVTQWLGVKCFFIIAKTNNRRFVSCVILPYV